MMLGNPALLPSAYCPCYPPQQPPSGVLRYPSGFLSATELVLSYAASRSGRIVPLLSGRHLSQCQVTLCMWPFREQPGRNPQNGGRRSASCAHVPAQRTSLQ